MIMEYLDEILERISQDTDLDKLSDRIMFELIQYGESRITL